MTDQHAVFITGATGLIGGQVLRNLLSADSELRVFALVRSLEPWRRQAVWLGSAGSRVTPVVGDITLPGLGIGRPEREYLGRHVTGVIHSAGDVCFSRTLAAARGTNRDGTRRVLEVSNEWKGVTRFAHISTAFVAGTRTGHVVEDDTGQPDSWVNGYEQSKAESERLVKTGCASAWTIFRPTTVACDNVGGRITQINAVHRSMRLLHAGLASMLPGAEDTPVDLTTAEYVAHAIAGLALAPGLSGRTLHLCAGKGAMPLGELLDRSYALWAAQPAWRRRSVARPALTDLGTYRLFEEAVHETADNRLRSITRSLSHFVPQLALPKTFDTTAVEALGFSAPAVHSFWEPMLQHLVPCHMRGSVKVAA